MASGPITIWPRDGETMETKGDFVFFLLGGLQNHWGWWLQPWQYLKNKKQKTCSLEKNLANLDSMLKSRDITLATKVSLVKALVSPVVMYGCWTIKKAWALKNWCYWIVVLEKTLESPLDSKEIQLVHPKGNQSWIFIGGTEAEAETPILWLPDVKNWLIWKDPDAGKDWRWEEKGTTEVEMVGLCHWLNGHEFE